MAPAQTEAAVPDVGKLRPVLDYLPCETCLDMYTPEQDYFCAICVRLTRDVVVRRAALASDEAVQIIAPEDFTMAKDLRDRIQSQELELQEAKDKLSSLSAREGELQLELKRLQDELDRARKERDEASLVPFEFVGVKEGKGEDMVEFTEDDRDRAAPATAASSSEPQPLAWEPADEAAAAPEPEPAPQWEAVEEPASPEPAPQWQEVAPSEEAPPMDEPAPEESAPTFQSGPEAVEAPARGPGRRVPSATADDAIARIEAEIAKIEKELQEVTDQEQGMVRGKRRRSKK